MGKFYETGKWHNWNGDSDCPFDKETTDYYIASFDTSDNHFYEKGKNNPKMGIRVYHKSMYSGIWKHEEVAHSNIAAFYIVSYNHPKEMTVKQIEEALGHTVKIVEE